MNITRKVIEDFGISQLERITLSEGDFSVELLNLGATIYSVKCKDIDGKIDDIVLGYPKWLDYLTNKDFLGCIAGRYANRIEGASFKLNGELFKVSANENTNCLHGGFEGLHKKFYDIEIIDDEVIFSSFSKDGEDGFPGNLNLSVRYKLQNSSLSISYEAKSDKDTIINLTNHSYFNLAGHNNGSILDHEFLINAKKYLPVNENLIPLDIEQVLNTPFDFTQNQPVASALRAPHPQISRCGGIDHNYILDSPGIEQLAAKAFHPYSGRTLEVYTSEPGVQFYTANHIDDMTGKDGVSYGKYPAFCLETQHYPNSPNRPDFPSTSLKAGDVYKSQTIYKFGVVS